MLQFIVQALGLLIFMDILFLWWGCHRSRTNKIRRKYSVPPLCQKMLFFSGWQRMDKNSQEIREVTVKMCLFHKSTICGIWSLEVQRACEM